MKVTIEFDLDEEKEEFEDFMNAEKSAAFIDNFGAHLRKLDKYSDEEMHSITELRDVFFDLKEDQGL